LAIENDEKIFGYYQLIFLALLFYFYEKDWGFRPIPVRQYIAEDIKQNVY